MLSFFEAREERKIRHPLRPRNHPPPHLSWLPSVGTLLRRRSFLLLCVLFLILPLDSQPSDILKVCAEKKVKGPDMSTTQSQKRRVGLVGYGKLGKFLASKILDETGHNLELAWVWNRTPETVTSDERVKHLHLADLSDFKSVQPAADIIVEVAHPNITREFGVAFLRESDYFCGSPTVFADSAIEQSIRQMVTSSESAHSLYMPSGALWGAGDILKMAKLGILESLTITMKKAPSSFKVNGAVLETLKQMPENATEEFVIYHGGLRALCPMAPNNVNTMACAAMAASNLGFDNVQARLVAVPNLKSHVVEVNVRGPGGFSVNLTRDNPATIGAVTGSLTFNSFWGSLLDASDRGSGVHFV